MVNPIAKGFSKYKLNTNFGANPCYYWIVIIIGTRFGTKPLFFINNNDVEKTKVIMDLIPIQNEKQAALLFICILNSLNL